MINIGHIGELILDLSIFENSSSWAVIMMKIVRGCNSSPTPCMLFQLLIIAMTLVAQENAIIANLWHYNMYRDVYDCKIDNTECIPLKENVQRQNESMITPHHKVSTFRLNGRSLHTWL